MGMAFPLFTQQMFAALTYKWANTLFAGVAVLMIPIPFVSSDEYFILAHCNCDLQILFFYGPRIRARSKFASQLIKKEMQAPTPTIISDATAV